MALKGIKGMDQIMNFIPELPMSGGFTTPTGSGSGGVPEKGSADYKASISLADKAIKAKKLDKDNILLLKKSLETKSTIELLAPKLTKGGFSDTSQKQLTKLVDKLIRREKLDKDQTEEFTELVGKFEEVKTSLGEDNKKYSLKVQDVLSQYLKNLKDEKIDIEVRKGLGQDLQVFLKENKVKSKGGETEELLKMDFKKMNRGQLRKQLLFLHKLIDQTDKRKSVKGGFDKFSNKTGMGSISSEDVEKVKEGQEAWEEFRKKGGVAKKVFSSDMTKDLAMSTADVVMEGFLGLPPMTRAMSWVVSEIKQRKAEQAELEEKYGSEYGDTEGRDTENFVETNERGHRKTQAVVSDVDTSIKEDVASNEEIKLAQDEDTAENKKASEEAKKSSSLLYDQFGKLIAATTASGAAVTDAIEKEGALEEDRNWKMTKKLGDIEKINKHGFKELDNNTEDIERGISSQAKSSSQTEDVISKASKSKAKIIPEEEGGGKEGGLLSKIVDTVWDVGKLGLGGGAAGLGASAMSGGGGGLLGKGAQLMGKMPGAGMISKLPGMAGKLGGKALGAGKLLGRAAPWLTVGMGAVKGVTSSMSMQEDVGDIVGEDVGGFERVGYGLSKAAGAMSFGLFDWTKHFGLDKALEDAKQATIAGEESDKKVMLKFEEMLSPDAWKIVYSKAMEISPEGTEVPNGQDLLKVFLQLKAKKQILPDIKENTWALPSEVGETPEWAAKKKTATAKVLAEQPVEPEHEPVPIDVDIASNAKELVATEDTALDQIGEEIAKVEEEVTEITKPQTEKIIKAAAPVVETKKTVSKIMAEPKLGPAGVALRDFDPEKYADHFREVNKDKSLSARQVQIAVMSKRNRLEYAARQEEQMQKSGGPQYTNFTNIPEPEPEIEATRATEVVAEERTYTPDERAKMQADFVAMTEEDHEAQAQGNAAYIESQKNAQSYVDDEGIVQWGIPPKAEATPSPENLQGSTTTKTLAQLEGETTIIVQPTREVGGGGKNVASSGPSQIRNEGESDMGIGTLMNYLFA